MKELAVAGKRIETRLLRRHPGGEWTGTTYQWNDDQTDAFLVEHTTAKLLPNGQEYSLPSPIECFVCHSSVAGHTIGLQTLQLNGDFQYGPGQSEDQLAKLSSIGYLKRPLDGHGLPRLPKLDSSAPLEDHARAYLHANCSMCHRDSGPTGSLIDLRYGLPLSALRSCIPSGGLETPDTEVIRPGDPEHSALFLRMSSRSGFTMPPLGSRRVDPVGVSLLETWIRSRTTCD